MARNLGPSCKVCRRLAESVCGKAKCAIIKRNYPPGQAGVRNPRPRLSQYAIQLREKQKAKAIYGLLERQFRNYYEQASKSKGNSGEMLLRLLETRLDNTVYRAGFAATRRQARQLVSHGHFEVNGRRCDIPSAHVRPGDVITLREKSQKGTYMNDRVPQMKMYEAPSWLQLDKKEMTVTVYQQPAQEHFEQNITVNLIIEYYSR